jgi:hypothetical protein
MTGKNSPQRHRDHRNDLLFTNTPAADFTLGALCIFVTENRTKQSQLAAGGLLMGAGPPGCPCQRWDPLCETKPISPQVPCGKRVAKNWMRGRPRLNKANCRTRSNGQRSPGLPAAVARPFVRNEANSPGSNRQGTGRAARAPSDGKRAKQSQLAAVRIHVNYCLERRLRDRMQIMEL